jgi:hypothetical protein
MHGLVVVKEAGLIMIAVLTLMVLIVPFGAEIGWLLADPPASINFLRATSNAGKQRSNTRSQSSRTLGQRDLWVGRVSCLDTTRAGTPRTCGVQLWMGGIAPLPNDGGPMTVVRAASSLARVRRQVVHLKRPIQGSPGSRRGLDLLPCA